MLKRWKTWVLSTAVVAAVPSIGAAVNVVPGDIPGGWVRRVVESPAAPGTYYASSWSVFKSTDFGRTWAAKPYPVPADADGAHFPRHGTWDIAVSTVNPNVVITGDQNETPVWYTADGGDTWTAASLENDGERRATTVVSFSLTASSRCFAAARINPNVGDVRAQYLYKSDDAGAHWTRPAQAGMSVSNQQSMMDIAQVPLGAGNRLLVAVVDRYYAFVGDGARAATGRIYYSDNNGDSFTQVALSWAPYSFAWDPGNGKIWAVSSDGAIYWSADGISWTQSRGAQLTGGQGGVPLYKIKYAVCGGTPMLFATSNNGGSANQSVYVSASPFTTWDAGSYVTNPDEDMTIYDIVPDTRDVTGHSWGMGTGIGGFYYTTDNGASATPARGINTRELRYGARRDNLVFAATFGGVIYTSTDSAATWARAYRSGYGSAIEQFITIHPTDTARVYISDGGMIKLSTCSGQGFGSQLGNMPAAATAGGMAFLTNLIIHPSTPSVMFVGLATKKGTSPGNFLFKSADGGATWSAVTGLTSHGMNAIAFDPKDPDIIYASCGSGYGTRPANGDFDGLWRSADGGATWSRTGAGIFDRGYLVTYAFDPDSDTMWNAGVYPDQGTGGVTDAVYVSTDAGAHWKMQLLNGSQINSSRIFYFKPCLYFGTAEGFLYKSDDRGQTWGIAMMLPTAIEWLIDAPGGGGGSAPFRRAPSAANSSLYAASGSGLYLVSSMGLASGITGGYGNPAVSGDGGIGSSDDQKGYAGGETKLYAWPNPYNPKNGGMMIRLGLPQGADNVTLRIFTLSGDLVAETSFSGQQGATYHGWPWYGTNQGGELCAPGLYFLVADVDGKILRHKIVVKY